MIDHISLGVRDLERSGRFYDAALAPLGIARCRTTPASIDYARDGEDDFGIHPLASDHEGRPSPQNHFAFRAASRQAVDQFYAVALAAGGRDDGPPGLRPQYHPGFCNGP